MIAISTLVFALPLWLADRYGRQVTTLDTMSFRQAALIGLAQLPLERSLDEKRNLLETARKLVLYGN